MSTAKKKDATLLYRGRPLRRKGDLVYYGSMGDKHIIMMQVLDNSQVKDLQVAKKVSVELQLTDPAVKSKERVVRRSEKNGLYSALDIASVWLERAAAGKL